MSDRAAEAIAATTHPLLTVKDVRAPADATDWCRMVAGLLPRANEGDNAEAG